ncbi:hypothetical protein DB345_11840 [Spartobacteria bacterium LR76]|nr:hypothetical protein DB345_11840 [Spartobacteria bacterium LR76]
MIHGGVDTFMPASFLSSAIARWFAIALFFWALALSAADLPPAEPVKVPTPAYGRCLELIEQTRQVLAAENIDGLEALAAELRTSKERLDGGTWLLSTYYGVLGGLPDGEQEQAGRIAFFEKWVAGHPESITARVALARALTSYAWKARGSGTSDTVSNEGWKLFGDRLAQAHQILDDARNLTQKCPGWYEAAQIVALGEGWETEEYFEMVGEAINKEPTYGRYYTNACYWMLPRWYGDEGEFEGWIAGLAKARPEADQDRQYAFLVWMADRMPVKGEIVFGDDRLDWARTREGFLEWIASEPDNLMVRFQLTRLALLAGDRETAREQFDSTGGRYFPEMWTQETFEAARKYAYEDGPNPLIKPKRTEQQTPRFDYETIRNIGIGVHVLLALAGGFLAGMLLMVIAWQRNEVWAGVITVFVAVLTSLPFGTIGSLVAGCGLLLYLRSRPARETAVDGCGSPWVTLLVALGLAFAYLGLQVLAVIPAIVPLLLEMGVKHQQAAVERMMTNGMAERILISSAWLVILGTMACCGTRMRLTERLGLLRPKLKASLIWLFVFFLVVAGLGYVIDSFLDTRSLEALRLMQLGRHSPVSFILCLCLFAPVAEELLFRGYAYTGWIRSMGWGLTALVSSLLFTAIHFQYGWAALAYVFVLGMLLALLRKLSGSVLPCIVLHSLANAIFVVSSFVSPLE